MDDDRPILTANSHGDNILCNKSSQERCEPVIVCRIHKKSEP